MFNINRIKAYPDGVIEYHYSDKVICEDKFGVSTIKETNKVKNGLLDRVYNIRNSYGNDRIYNDIQTRR